MNTTTLTVGDTAPDFSAIAVGAEFADGKPIRLSDYFPEQIVLYFYPQDHTPACQIERRRTSKPHEGAFENKPR
jgi:peroxiredoxin